MIEIGMHKIYKNFGYKQVLKDINFEILTGDRVGIVGKMVVANLQCLK